MRYLKIVANVQISIHKFKHFEENLYIWNIYKASVWIFSKFLYIL